MPSPPASAATSDLIISRSPSPAHLVVTKPDDDTPSQLDSKGPPRPPLRNNFDLEPNPFERSFSVSSTSIQSLRNNDQKHSPEEKHSPTASSSSNASSHRKPAPAAPTNSTTDSAKPTLPPLASIASPSDPSYAWALSSAGLTGSLRAGPLSPAMLAGPQNQNSTSHHHPILAAFDPSASFRTGLTPSTGLTPLVGGPVSFPPPSPNTAAFLAMVNSSSSATAVNAAAATITPNTLNALTGILQQQSTSSSIPPTQNGDSRFNSSSFNQQQQSVSNPTQQQHFNTAANAATAAANGLFLLSQAHQELTKREEAQKNQSQNGANNGSHNGADPVTGNGLNAKRGAKRKPPPEPAPIAPAAKSQQTSKRSRTQSNASARTRRGSTVSNMDDGEGSDDDEDVGDYDESTQSNNPNRKPETDEEKRKNFLERNRQAALKCRQRKKAWLTQLQAKVEYLANENERLTSALVSSREEISRLSALVGSTGVGAMVAGLPHHQSSHLQQQGGHAHVHGGAHGVHGPHSQIQVGQPVPQPVSVSVSLPPGGESAIAGAPIATAVSGRGYGY